MLGVKNGHVGEPFELFDDGGEPIIVGRTPYLPADVARDIFAAPQPLEALQRVLRQRADIMLALYIASPTLHAAAQTWLANGRLKNAKTPLRVLAYIVRMATRPTPMGLCAAIGSVVLGEKTSLVVLPVERWKTRSRVDMGWLGALVKSVEDDPQLRERLTVFANDLVLERGGRLYVMSSQNTRAVGTGQNVVVEYTPVSLRATIAVKRARELAREGLTLQTLKSALMREFDLDDERATRLLEGLWKSGLFISELRPSLVDDAIARVEEHLIKLSALHADALHLARTRFKELDRAPITRRSVHDYAAVNAQMQEICKVEGVGMQVDTMCEFAGFLGAEVVRDVRLMAHLFFRCARRFSIDTYRARFFERYESGERLVPLLELVDPDFGLGPPEESNAEVQKSTPLRERALYELAAGAIAEHRYEVVLTAAELERYLPQGDTDAYPWSFEIGVQIAAHCAEAINDGDYLLAPAALVGTHGAGKSIGRFSDMIGAQTMERLRARVRECCPDDAVFAELVFNPSEGRAANVAIRPSLAGYELQVGLRSDGHARLALDELLVGLDHDRFFCYSTSLKKRVIVVENHLLNTAYSSPNVCRFLSSAAREGTRVVVGFDWRRAVSLPFLPRLRHGRIVLALARWQLESAFFRVESDAALRGVSRPKPDVVQVVPPSADNSERYSTESSGRQRLVVR